MFEYNNYCGGIPLSIVEEYHSSMWKDTISTVGDTIQYFGGIPSVLNILHSTDGIPTKGVPTQ